MARELLRGCRVLIVEDELLIALDLCDKVEELGCIIIGPANSVEKALSLLETESPDLALLDENLAGRTVLPVAEELQSRRVPFVIVSGYNSALSDDPVLVNAQRLAKPVSTNVIRRTLQELLRSSS